MNNIATKNIEEYIDFINKKSLSRLTEKQVYELVKTRFSYNFLPNSKKESYQTINKKIISNSYNDLIIMKEMCRKLCIKNIDIYKNWLDTFCGTEFFNKKFNKGNNNNIKTPNGKIDISFFEKYLLPKCNVSQLKLSSIVENNGINNETNIHRSVGILTKILKDSENRKIQIQKKEEVRSGENTIKKNQEATLNNDIYTKEYCIITNEFCKNIRQIWSMLPRNDINLKDYNSSMKNIIKKKRSFNKSNQPTNILVGLVNKLFNN